MTASSAASTYIEEDFLKEGVETFQIGHNYSASGGGIPNRTRRAHTARASATETSTAVRPAKGLAENVLAAD